MVDASSELSQGLSLEAEEKGTRFLPGTVFLTNSVFRKYCLIALENLAFCRFCGQVLRWNMPVL
jgi:hypothetical protein